MRVIMVCALFAMVFCFSAPVIAKEPLQPDEVVVDSDSGDISEMPLDDREGYNTSSRLAAEGRASYDENTGMMDVVPSDSEGNIED